MQMAEKVCVLTLLQEGNSVIAVARDIGVSREAFFSIKKAGCVITTRDNTEEKVVLWRT